MSGHMITALTYESSEDLELILLKLEEVMENCRRDLQKMLPAHRLDRLDTQTIARIEQMKKFMSEPDRNRINSHLYIFRKTRRALDLCLNENYSAFLAYARGLK